MTAITFACGHLREIPLTFTTDEAGLKAIEYFEKQVCTSCLAAEFEDFNNLPKLTGTDKQVDWARSIRHKILDGAQNLLQEAEESGLNITTLQDGYAGMLTKLEAKWWIDARNKQVSRLLLAKYTQKVCPGCGNNFAPKMSSQKYCNISCRNHAALMRELNPDSVKAASQMFM